MAQASSLAEKIYLNFLQCGICLEPFHNPRALPCLHAFCEECLERWYKTNKKNNPGAIICPNCKQSAEIPSEGIKGFPAHFMVNSLQETVDMEKAKEDYSNQVCTKCNTPDKKAKVYCQDCKHFLCESCLDLHKAWMGLKHRQVLSVEDLNTGKITLSDSDKQEQNCADHEGEQKRFYCETCGKPVCRDCIVMKQHCRDHDYITFKQASDKQVNHIKESIKTCREMKVVCQNALDKAKLTEESLSSNEIRVKDTLDSIKAEFLTKIDDLFYTHKTDIDKIHKERATKLSKKTDNLKTVMNQIDSTLELGVNLTESGSLYDIVSNYTSVLNSLQKVNDIKVDEVDETMANILIPVVTCVLPVCKQWERVLPVCKQWEQTRKFKVKCNNGKDISPTGIATLSNGNIALCKSYHAIHVYSWSGEFKHTLPTQGLLGGVGDVAVMTNNVYVVPTYRNKCCQLYSSQCKLISEFPTCNAKSEPSEANAVTVDKDGCIILGMKDNAISIHNSDGSVKSRFALPYPPESVAVTSKQEIVIATGSKTLELLNYSGQSILTLDPPPEVNTWVPCYVCCSKRDEVFVVNRGDPRAIYKYAAGSVYMGCITTQVNNPWGIALSHDDKELFVTEYRDKEVKIFRRP